MFTVVKTNVGGSQVFPDQEYLADYKDSDFGSMISTMGVNCIIGSGIFELGDSGVSVKLTSTREKGEEGIAVFKQYATDMVEIIKEALPAMSAPYKAFYQQFVDDFANNGLHMPHYGKVL